MGMVIALHGRLQAGKDTTFERIKYLAMQLPQYAVPGVEGRTFPVITTVERLAFADPLKDSAAALLGVTREELEWMKVDEGPSISIRVPLGPAPDYRYRTVGLTGRQYLQRYGTESHRDVFGDNFWVDQAIAKVSNDPRAVTVITDCRFPNEVMAVRSFGNGYVVHVVGPQGKGEGDHASEQVLDDTLIDMEIDNSVRGDNFAHLDAEIKQALPFLNPDLDNTPVGVEVA